MKTIITTVALSLFVAANAAAADFEGPLVVKNGHPLYAALNGPSLSSAEPRNFLDLTFTYSSTYLVDNSSSWDFGVDIETAALDIQVEKIVANNLSLGFDVPLLRYGSGFMDGVLNSYHQAIGVKNAYGRNDRPRNSFLLQVACNGQPVIEGRDNEALLGDVSVDIKKRVYRNNATAVSVQGFMNLPTGDPDAGAGSGRMNGGAALLLNQELGGDVMLYLNGGYGIIDELRALQSVKLRNYSYGGLGLEWKYSEKLLVNGQVFVERSPFPSTGVSAVDDPSMTASIGGRYRLGPQSTLALVFTEDPDIAGAPDFMLSISFRRGF